GRLQPGGDGERPGTHFRSGQGRVAVGIELLPIVLRRDPVRGRRFDGERGRRPGTRQGQQPHHQGPAHDGTPHTPTCPLPPPAASFWPPSRKDRANRPSWLPTVLRTTRFISRSYSSRSFSCEKARRRPSGEYATPNARPGISSVFFMLARSRTTSE